MPPSPQDAPEPRPVVAPYERLLSLRLHQTQGRRSPHKPLLALLAIGRLLETGSSALPWSVAQVQLADLIAEFGPASRTAKLQGAAYPFTRLRTDGVWQLDADVANDQVSSLRNVTGSFVPAVEAELRGAPERALATARALVTSHFPDSLVSDVLLAAGLDPSLILGSSLVTLPVRRRSATWRGEVIQAWDHQCAFCGWDGQLGGAAVGLDAAHVRWFSYDGPDAPDNGLALCSLHHKLFDRGALGLDAHLRVRVSRSFTARTATGKAVYDLHGMALRPRPGTVLPADVHVSWHAREVFKGEQLSV